MAIEKKLPDIAPHAFIADGNQFGVILLQKTIGFKVKQQVVLGSSTQPNIVLEVKRVYPSKMIVGPKGPSPGKTWLQNTKDISTYLVVDGAYVYAAEQDKSTIRPDDIIQAVYEQEPAVAIRTIFVDANGDLYGEGNPLPIAFDGTVAVGNVTIQDDNGHELAVNADGSINVNVVVATVDGPGLGFQYGEVTGVAPGLETTVLTVTAPVVSKRIEKIEVSGTNVAEIRIKYNGTIFTKKYLWHGAFNVTFAFETYVSGFKVNVGQNVTVTVVHNRPDPGDFNATAYYV